MNTIRKQRNVRCLPKKYSPPILLTHRSAVPPPQRGGLTMVDASPTDKLKFA